MDIALSIARPISVDTRFDDAVVGQHPTALQRHAITRSQAFLIEQAALRLHLKHTARRDHALGFNAAGLHVNGAGRRCLAHDHMATGINLNITASDHVPRQLHADTRLGPHQLDCAHIHAAQCRRVNRQIRRLAAIRCPRRGIQGASVDVVTTSDDGEFFRLDLRIDGGGAGDDFELIDVAGVQAGAFDSHTAPVHLVTIDLAVFNHGFTGGERRLRGVDKAATVTADAIRVGNDHMGRLPSHFGVAAQLAGAAAVDFVENDIGRGAVEVGVADNDAAQLGGLGTVGGVIEDDPVGANVVVMKLVVREAVGVRRGDVDDGHAIARLSERSTWSIHHNAVCLGQQRVPEHGVGQNQCQPTFRQPQEMGAAFYGSRRLAREECVLANVHVMSRSPKAVKNLKEKVQTEIDRRFTVRDRFRSFQRVCKGHAGRDVLAARKQLHRVAAHAPMLLGVVAAMADDALVVAQAGAVFSEHRLHPGPSHRPTPAQVVAPVAAAVAGKHLVFVATNRRLPAEAHALWAEQHVFAVLTGHQTAETEGLTPQFEWIQIAHRGGVLAVARIGLPRLWIVIGLGIECADAVLHAKVNVEE